MNGARPRAIAHRAGNSRAALSAALTAGVDWIEVDLWWRFGRLVACHDRPLWPLPFSVGSRRVGLMLDQLSFSDLLHQTRQGPQLLLDFKGGGMLAAGVVETLQRHQATTRVAICGQVWSVLDTARRLEPALRTIYSFGGVRHVLALRRRPPSLLPIDYASVNHVLLTEELMREFNERRIRVFAWTVNDRNRAHELTEMGVAGIISDSLDLLRDICLLPGVW